MMFEKVKPDFYFTHYREITPTWLKEQDVKFILADLDGTLAPQDEREDEEFAVWYNTIEKAGVGLIIVSNNTQKRVDDFIERYKIVGMGRCGKPKTKKIQESFFHKGLNPETTLFLGDQLFTDVWCGKQLGLKTVLVESIPGNELWHRKIKAFVENILLKGWKLK